MAGQHLQPVLQDLDAETQKFILWATPPGGEPEYRHRPSRGAARCRERRVGHLGFVPPLLQSGSVVQLAASVLADSPGMCRWLLSLLQLSLICAKLGVRPNFRPKF